jgi:hypothetical protein
VSSAWPPRPEEELTRTEEEERILERNKRGAIALGSLAALAVVLSYAGAGYAGLVVSLSVVAAGVLVAAAFTVPVGPARTRRRSAPVSPDEPYPSFQQVSERLSWAKVSPRHYDLVTRPLLVRVLANRLADHHGVDLYRHREAARALVGEELWWWFDPDREPERSSQPPGVDDHTLTRLVQRLETL